MNFKYFLMKSSCVALALAIAFSSVFFLFGICNVVMFQNRNFIKNSIVNQKQDLITDVGASFDGMQDSFSVPIDAVKLGLEKDAINVVASMASNNFVYSYSTDFTDGDEMYNVFSSAISQYCRENNINVTDEQISENASLAVTVMNKELGGTATHGVKVFEMSKNKLIAIIIGLSAIVFVASFFLLDFINYGRHRKYSYIGMGLVTSGYVMTLIPLYVQRKGFAAQYNHCNNPLYNNAINDLYSYIFYVFILAGIVFFVTGIVVLIVNYHYFKKKGERVRAARESSEQMKSEYLLQYNEKRRRDGVEKNVGRHTMKIDFDE